MANPKFLAVEKKVPYNLRLPQKLIDDLNAYAEITGNTTTNGGAITLEPNSTFTMNGGTISNNVATNNPIPNDIRDMSSLSADEKKLKAKEFSEGNFELEKLLLLLWTNKKYKNMVDKYSNAYNES